MACKFLNKASPIEDYTKGDLLSYPCDDNQFVRQTEIDKDVAIAIANHFPNGKHFINKLAVVIAVDDYRNVVTAVYSHDCRYWIIAKRFKD